MARKRLERSTYQIRLGRQSGWYPSHGESDVLFIATGEVVGWSVAREMYDTKEKAINCGRGYYASNVVVIDIETNTVVYERKNGIVLDI